MSSSKNTNKPIAISDLPYMDTLAIIMFIMVIHISTVLSVDENIGVGLFWLITLPVLFFTSYLVVYYYFSQIKFYEDRVDLAYTIRHHNVKVKSIPIDKITKIKFRYPYGRFSMDLARITIYYIETDQIKKARCRTQINMAERVLALYKEKGIVVDYAGTLKFKGNNC